MGQWTEAEHTLQTLCREEWLAGGWPVARRLLLGYVAAALAETRPVPHWMYQDLVLLHGYLLVKVGFDVIGCVGLMSV